MKRALVIVSLIAAACSSRSSRPAPHDDAAVASGGGGSPFERFAELAPAVGAAAPDFTLTDVDGASVTLSDATARGPVVLIFGSFT